MSIDIEVRIADADEYMGRLATLYGEKFDGGLATNIMKCCGMFVVDEHGKRIYILLQNEYWDEFNPYYTLFELLDCAFKKEGSHTEFLEHSRCGIAGVERSDIAEEFGIDLNWEPE